MDGLTFTVGIVKALAWPLAVVVIALLFRKQLIDLLATIKRGKFGSAEIEFERGVKTIEASASSTPATPPPDATIKEAAFNPRAAVLEAWLRLEDQVIDLAMRRGLTNATARRYAHGALVAVKQSGLLSPASLRLLDKLQDLRNWAVHYPDFSPDPEAVITYMQSAAALGQELQALAGT